MIEATDDLVHSSDSLFRQLDDETVLYHAESGLSMLLDPMGTLLWTCFEQPVSATALAADFAAEFDEGAEIIEQQVLDLAQTLAEQGFLTKASL